MAQIWALADGSQGENGRERQKTSSEHHNEGHQDLADQEQDVVGQDDESSELAPSAKSKGKRRMLDPPSERRLRSKAGNVSMDRSAGLCYIRGVSKAMI